MIQKIRNLLYSLECRLFPIDMDKIYNDQSSRSKIFGDRVISSYYLPEGIRQLDSDYTLRIMGGMEDQKKLRKEIKSNPHLHKRIKRNLLLNLQTYERD